MVNYAIETINLFKRYPTSTRGRKLSLIAILRTLMRRGPFITALNGVTLRIKRGEIFGLLGPNGAGKTTFMKILCTLVLPDEGETYVNGFDVRREPRQVLKNLQAIFSETKGFEWRLTARQNLELYALLYGLMKKEAEKKIDHLLSLTSLKDRQNDMYQRYSTGMARRLLLCKALLLDTPILLFDEPTIGLDPPSAKKFRSLLRDKLSREQDKTVFISTHNMWEAEEMCDRVAIIDHGKVLACGSPDNIRYLLGDDRTFQIAFLNMGDSKEYQKMTRELQRIRGVKDVIPSIDINGTLRKLTVRVDKKLGLDEILNTIMVYPVKIESINVAEPTLEETFIALTKKEG